MKIYYEENLQDTSFSGSAIALGSFESLHAGHIEIIRKTISCAKEKNIKSIVTIFEKPILKTRDTVCETLNDRLKILKKLGTDIVVIFRFNEEFKNISDVEFFHNILLKKLNVKHIFAGFNYRFGRNAEGTSEKLIKLCDCNNIGIEIVPPVKKGIVISSTHIYDLIKSGNAEEIQSCLLRPYSLTGKIVHGRHIGESLGFPTANIDFPKEKAIISEGVYFGKCYLNSNEYSCIINVGNQPTITKDNTPKIETHILEFNEDIYSSEIKIDFYKKIREIKSFENINELKNQLQKDKEYAKNLIEANK